MIYLGSMIRSAILKLSMEWHLMKKIETKYFLKLNYPLIKRVFKKHNLKLMGLEIRLIKLLLMLLMFIEIMQLCREFVIIKKIKLHI